MEEGAGLTMQAVREEIERALADAPSAVYRLAEECAERNGLWHGRLVWTAAEAVWGSGGGGSARMSAAEFGAERSLRASDAVSNTCVAAAAMELLAWFARLHGEAPPPAGVKPSDLLLTGDFFYAKSLSLASGLPREAAPLYADLACRYAVDRLRLRERVSGQARTMREELEHAFAKSGRWTATCCRIGALLHRASAPVEEALTAYGFALGMYQHLDAILHPRREEIRPLLASYRKRASSHLSALPESEAKSRLLQAVQTSPSDPEKRRAFLNV
jgi:hypothetical protein